MEFVIMVAPKMRAGVLSTLEKLKVRNLYFAQALTHEEIAKQVGKPHQAVSRFIQSSKLPALKRDRERALIARADAKVSAQLDEISDTIVSECEEIALASLANARSALTDTHKDAPKNFQAWTAGARNLVSIRQALRNGSADTLDSSGGKDTRNVAVFFMSGETKRAEKRVGSVVDASGV